ncbi:TlpA disulfide reductase family protein [Jiulongibacter sediminis]|jgi:peroxiredoxin|uniref:TlpA family protein disulfide reductase n=1 Tax=Jiulongibacter sediminis TaxID=1605367 RepID=UPI0026EC9AC8|nr:TlpA disulfide reductase family protein [Jiulongibacter sediminis]
MKVLQNFNPSQRVYSDTISQVESVNILNTAMRHFLTIASAIILLNSACKESTQKVEVLETFEHQSQDFMIWWVYYNDSINLSSDFLALDSLGNEMSKSDFLEVLTTSRFLPMKLPGELKYQLYKPQKKLQEDVFNTIMWQSKDYLHHYRMEGLTLTDSPIKTLEGQEHQLSDPKGKYLIVKCWFVACHQCIEEMPELNEMVKKYESRGDMTFLSLAFDDEDKLRNFLSKREFIYETASVPEGFLESELRVTAYPTHMVIGKDGKVLKVVNGADQLKNFLAKEILDS